VDFQGAAGVWGLGDTDPIWEELLPGVIGCWPVWPVPDAVRPGEEVGFDEVGSESTGQLGGVGFGVGFGGATTVGIVG